MAECGGTAKVPDPPTQSSTKQREENVNSSRFGLAGLGCIVTALFAASAAFAQPAPVPQPSAAHPWVQGAPFPEPSEEVLGATAGGKLYVFAGLAPGWKPKAMVVEYDPASNTWTKKKPMRLASHHVALASLNDKIYAFGGFAFPGSGPPGWNPVNNAWEYDPVADEWKELAPMPTRRGAASAGVVNGKIYVTGGANSLPGLTENGIHPARPHNVVATVEEYDPATNTWKMVRPLLLARNHHVAVGAGDKLYVIGGRVGGAFISSASNNVDLVEMYDPAADLWTPRTRMPTARSAIGAGRYNNNILVAGGEGQDQRFLAAFKAVEAYDTVLNRWEVLPSMLHQRHGLAAAVIGNRFYTVSGDAQSAGNGIEHSAVAYNEILQLDLVLK
jgi:N-acetylneuraminic acid mutarotase